MHKTPSDKNQSKIKSIPLILLFSNSSSGRLIIRMFAIGNFSLIYLPTLLQASKSGLTIIQAVQFPYIISTPSNNTFKKLLSIEHSKEIPTTMKIRSATAKLIACLISCGNSLKSFGSVSSKKGLIARKFTFGGKLILPFKWKTKGCASQRGRKRLFLFHSPVVLNPISSSIALSKRVSQFVVIKRCAYFLSFVFSAKKFTKFLIGKFLPFSSISSCLLCNSSLINSF